MHYLAPSPEKAHVAIFYRNFLTRGGGNYCHVGLGVNGMHTCKVLRKHHIRADLFGVWEPRDIDNHLAGTALNGEFGGSHNSVTHAVIEAPWVPADKLYALMCKYPTVHFLVRNHSQIGFLQVEAGAVKMVRDYFRLQDSSMNFTYAANNERYCEYAERVYHGRCLLLPNLYDLDRPHRKQPRQHNDRLLRIASFGSLRLLKNHTSSAAAAQLIAKSKACDLDFYISTNREEHGKGVLQAIKYMFMDTPGLRVVENPWQPWADFRHTVRHMDLVMQPSFTETFNIVSADACSEGVPVIGSAAIEWLPKHWHSSVDDPLDIARVGLALLHDHHAAAEGLRALENYQDHAIARWLRYLGGRP